MTLFRLLGPCACTLSTALSLAASAAASPAGPDRPALYAQSAAIQLAPAEGLQRLSLPWAVLQASRSPGLADVRVFDAEGQVLPMAWAQIQPSPARQRELALPRFAWPDSPPHAPDKGELLLRLQAHAQGQRLSLQAEASDVKAGSPPGAERQAPLAKTWLLDLSALQAQAHSDESISQLHLDWPARAGGLSTQLQVEASADAQQWHRITEVRLLDLPPEAAASSAQAPSAGFSIKSLAWPQQPGAQARPRYLRLHFDTALHLSRSDITLSRRSLRPSPQETTLRFEPQATQPGQAPQWTADLQGPIAPLALRVQLPDQNSLLHLRLEQRQREDQAWQPVSQFVAWRLWRAGEAQSAPAHPLQAAPARYWRLLGDSSAGPLAKQPLQVQWQWQAPQLVLLARGAAASGAPAKTAPLLHLAVGREAAPMQALPLASLIPGYQEGAEFQLPEAQLAALQRQPAPGPLAQLGPETLRQAALWGVLIVSVLGLGWMARRLRQHSAAPTSEG